MRRAARGGRVALPGRPEQPVQVIDSRDLAHLVVRLLLDDRPGAFNAVGPAEPATMADVLTWDRERGEPPLRRGFSPDEEARLLAP